MLAIFFGYHVMVGQRREHLREKRIEDRELHKQIDALQQENGLKEHLDR